MSPKPLLHKLFLSASLIGVLSIGCAILCGCNQSGSRRNGSFGTPSYSAPTQSYSAPAQTYNAPAQTNPSQSYPAAGGSGSRSTPSYGGSGSR